MNLDQLRRKNVGFHVQIEPPAIYLDAFGCELPRAESEDWIIQASQMQSPSEHRQPFARLSFVVGNDAIA